jgi:hypothetical protein
MRGGAEPSSLHEHAAEHLRFIRDTMARASGFTAVPGWGGVLMGMSAVATAILAGPPRESIVWLGWWLGDAVVATAIGLIAMTRKAARTGTALDGPAARRFAFAFLPPIVAAAILTVMFIGWGWTTRLPGCWLLLYGAGVASAGALSVSLVPIMGLCLMTLGAVALSVPPAWGNVMMAVGFGGIQMIFGIMIARKYGG